MHLLFLTTANLSSNPRLVKEIRVALTLNYRVTVLLFNLKQWTIGLEEEYTKQFPQVTFVYLPITKRYSYSWFSSSLLSLIAKQVCKFLKSSLFIAALASDKRSYVLHQKLGQLNLNSVDLVIAHNLGALYPAYQYAKQHQIPFGFDVEDFHPGEIVHADKKNEINRRTLLMQQLLPKADYVTAASPLIAQEVRNLCKVQVTTINNSFYSSEFELPEIYVSADAKIKFVWFSQNINYGRGLELILPALDEYKDTVTLTLIGNLNQQFANTYLQNRTYVDIVAPLKQGVLHKELSNYDVGLALELRSADFNREIALTNKIFAYKQAGLFILATNTKAQTEFMEQYKEDGCFCEQTVEALIAGVATIINNISTIRAGKTSRFKQAIGIAFETEAQKLVALWEKTLQKQA